MIFAQSEPLSWPGAFALAVFFVAAAIAVWAICWAYVKSN